MPVRSFSRRVVPIALSRSTALNSEFGVPRYWATVYSSRNLAPLAPKTAYEKLKAIDTFYGFTKERLGSDCLDQLIGDFATDKLEALLQAFFSSERNYAASTGTDRGPRWRAVRDFVLCILELLAATDHDTIRVRSLNAQLARWRFRYRNLLPSRPRQRNHALRALPALVLEELYSVFNPESRSNPFRTERLKWRNLCIFLCAQHQGMRRGEILLLPANAVSRDVDHRSYGLRYWINVQNQFADEDPRYCDAPSIKNSQSVRQIPVSEKVASLIDRYANNYRGKSRHPHLFLNNRGEPLGTRGFTEIFARASTALSEAAVIALKQNMRSGSISAHDFRHTCAVTRLAHFRASGISEEEALAKLRSFFGWSYNSSMPLLYARAYWEREIETAWDDDFDSHVDALRSLQPGGWETEYV